MPFPISKINNLTEIDNRTVAVMSMSFLNNTFSI